MRAEVIHGDCLDGLRSLPSESVHCCVTSPPYWGLRDYGHEGQIGLEETPEAYVARLVEVFREVRRVLREDGTLWLNLGDSYAAARGGTTPPAETLGGGVNGRMPDGSRVNRDRKNGYNPSRNATAIGLKHKDLVGIPWRVAFALQADGWYLRSDIIWSKPNPMPESVKDRPTKAHEYVFLLTKSARYWYDKEAVREEPKPWNEGRISAPKMGAHRLTDAYGQQTQKQYDEINGANARSVWSITTQPYPEAHFATFPPELPRRCIRAGCPAGGTVLDPFSGSGTTGAVAVEEGRAFVGIELNPSYIELAQRRIRAAQPPLFTEGGAL